MFAPLRCPSCGEFDNWKCIGTDNKGFSTGKAVTGAILFGPVGLVGGTLGKKMDTYYCAKCGFRNDYDHDQSRQKR